MKIHYEPHPVSAERKAELVKQGFKIIDARFQPEEEKKPEPKRTTRAKSKKAD